MISLNCYNVLNIDGISNRKNSSERIPKSCFIESNQFETDFVLDLETSDFYHKEEMNIEAKDVIDNIITLVTDTESKTCNVIEKKRKYFEFETEL